MTLRSASIDLFLARRAEDHIKQLRRYGLVRVQVRCAVHRLALRRAITYLRDKPAQAVLNSLDTKDHQ